MTNGLAQSSEGSAVRAEDQDTMLCYGSELYYIARRERLQGVVLPVRSADADTVRGARDADYSGIGLDTGSTVFDGFIQNCSDALGRLTDDFIARHGVAPVWRCQFGPLGEVRRNGEPFPVSYSVTYTIDVGETLRRAAQVAVEGHKAEVPAAYREPA